MTTQFNAPVIRNQSGPIPTSPSQSNAVLPQPNLGSVIAVAAFAYSNPAGVGLPSDSAGNSYTFIGNAGDGAGNFVGLYKGIVANTGAGSLNVGWPGAGGIGYGLWAAEVTGTDGSLDGLFASANVSLGSSGSIAVTANSIVTTFAQDLIISAIEKGQSGNISANTGTLVFANIGAGAGNLAVQQHTTSITGNYAESFTATNNTGSDEAAIVAAAFKGAEDFTFVRQTENSSSAALSNISLNSFPVNANGTLFVAVASFQTVPVSLNSALGNNFVLVSQAHAPSNQQYLTTYVLKDAIGGNETLNVTFNAASTLFAIAAAEFSGFDNNVGVIGSSALGTNNGIGNDTVTTGCASISIPAGIIAFAYDTQGNIDNAGTSPISFTGLPAVWANLGSGVAQGKFEYTRVLVPGTYGATFGDLNFDQHVASMIAVALPITAPYITTQPIGATVLDGADATFTVAAQASNGALSYQWQQTLHGVTTNVGTNSATYKAAFTASQTGALISVVLADGGTGSTTSSSAIVTVRARRNAPRRIRRIPTSYDLSGRGWFSLSMLGSTLFNRDMLLPNGSGIVNTTFTPAQGSISFNGQIPVANTTTSGAVNTTFSPGTGAISFAGQAPIALSGAIFVPATGALAGAGLLPQALAGTISTPPVGSASFVGLAPLALRGTIFTPATGSITATGAQPIALAGAIFTPGVGSITAASAAPTLLAGQISTPGAGTASFAGLTPSLLIGTISTPGAGSGVFQGLTPSVLVSSPGNTNFAPSNGTATFVGLAPSLLLAQFFAPAAGSGVFQGFAPTVLVSSGGVSGTGVVQFVGQAPTLIQGQVQAVPNGSAAFAGLQPSLIQGQLLPTTPGSAAFVGLAPAIGLGLTLPVGSVAFVGLAPSLLVAMFAQPGAGSAAFTGFAPTVTVTQGSSPTFVPGTASVAFAGLAPSLLIASIFQPGAGSAAFVGLAPTILVGISAQPAVASLTLQGFAPTALIGQVAQPTTGSAAFAGLAPTVLTPLTLQPDQGAAQFAGLAPSLVLGLLSQPGVGSAAFVGLQPSVVLGIVAQPGTGTVSFAGQTPSIGQTGSLIFTPGCGSITFVGADYGSGQTVLVPDSGTALDGVGWGRGNREIIIDRTHRPKPKHARAPVKPGSVAFEGFAPTVVISTPPPLPLPAPFVQADQQAPITKLRARRVRAAPEDTPISKVRIAAKHVANQELAVETSDAAFELGRRETIEKLDAEMFDFLMMAADL